MDNQSGKSTGRVQSFGTKKEGDGKMESIAGDLKIDIFIVYANFEFQLCLLAPLPLEPPFGSSLQRL